MANVLKTDCSIKPIGDRGCVIPSVRKNPRFPSGTQFSIKTVSINGLLIKFSSCNSIFTILAADAPMVLGVTLAEFNDEIKLKRAEGIRLIAVAAAEIFTKENGWATIQTIPMDKS